MKKYVRNDVLAIGIIACVIALFFIRLIFPKPQLIITPDFGQSDAVWSYATKQVLGLALKNHTIPIWTSLIGGGYPLHAQGAMGTFYIPNLILFSILPTIYAYTIGLFFSLCLLGWGTYIWLRLMGYRRLSSLFGSVTLALSGYSIVQFTHIMIIQSFALMPLLAAITSVLAKRKTWFVTGMLSLLLSQQILIGFPQTVFITLLFLLAYYGYLIRSSPTKLTDMLRIGVGFVGGMGIAAIQLLPSIEYSSTLVSSGGFTPDIATAFSYPFKHLITLFSPFFLGNPANGTYPHFSSFDGSIFWENTAYIGVVPIICLFLFLCIRVFRANPGRKRIPEMTFFLLAAVGAILMATGKHSPLYFIFSFWPFTIFRAPSRFLWVFTVALVVVCTHAFEACFTMIRQKRLGLLIASLAIVLQILTVMYVWSPYHDLEPAATWLEPPTLSQYIDRGGYTLTIGGERAYANTYQNHGWTTKDANNHPSYILRNTFTPDKSMLWSVPQIKEYAGRSIRRSKVFDDLLDQSVSSNSTNATISAFGTKLLHILSVKNVISTLPLTQKGLLSIAKLADSTRQITLYTNPEALPKLYIAQSTIPVATIEQAIELFMSQQFIPGKTVLVENGQAATVSAQTRIRLVDGKDGRYEVHISTPEPGAILVLAETYYPGWHAYIGGKETRVFPVNIKHIGVRLPQGEHTVILSYLPDSFIRGRWISGITLVLTISAMVFFRLLGI